MWLGSRNPTIPIDLWIERSGFACAGECPHSPVRVSGAAEAIRSAKTRQISVRVSQSNVRPLFLSSRVNEVTPIDLLGVW